VNRAVGPLIATVIAVVAVIAFDSPPRHQDLPDTELVARQAEPTACGADDVDDEPNDTRATAAPLLATPIDGYICDDPDVYAIATTSGQVTIDLTPDTSAGDLDIALYDDAGTRLATSDQPSGPDQIDPGPLTAGTYYLEVYGFDGGAGDYELAVTGIDAGQDVSGTVTVWDPVTHTEEPAEGVVVEAHQAATPGVIAQAETGQNGEFAFDPFALDPGNLKFRFTEPSGGAGAWTAEWHQNRADHATADTLTLVDGVPLQVDAALLTLTLQTHPFTDVPPWANDGVTYVHTYKIAEGITATTFEPNSNITRAQLVRMLYRMAGSPQPCDPNYQHPFTDVPAWVEDAVTWASCDNGTDPPVVTGTTSTTFSPNTNSTRAQTVRMVHRFSGDHIPTGGLPPHGLDDVPAWVEQDVRWALWDADSTGSLEALMAGINGHFLPNDPITRGQFARLLWRLALSQPHWDITNGSIYWQDHTTPPGSVRFR
jgi:hypothetical protein